MKRFSYLTITPDEFRAALDDVGISYMTFCRLTNLDKRRIERMLNGKANIPVWIPLLLQLLKVKGALGVARMTAAALIERDNKHPELGGFPYMRGRELPPDFIAPDDKEDNHELD